MVASLAGAAESDIGYSLSSITAQPVVYAEEDLHLNKDAPYIQTSFYGKDISDRALEILYRHIRSRMSPIEANLDEPTRVIFATQPRRASNLTLRQRRFTTYTRVYG